MLEVDFSHSLMLNYISLKLTRALGVNTIIEHLSSALDIASETQVVKDRSSLTEDELRCVYFLCSKI